MYQREMKLASTIAREAGELELKYWNSGTVPEEKYDLSPVTIADREAEQMIAKRLSEAYPDDGILGEEGAERPSRSGRRWIIDPIDGTRDFVRGNRFWSVLIGLEEDGEVVAGITYFPAMGDLFTAARGEGAFCNGERVHVSGIQDASKAVICVNTFGNIGRYPFAPALFVDLPKFWAVRSMGGCLDAVMVARGQADLWIESAGQAWDFAPLKILAEEAGGRFFNFDGGSSIYGGNCVICTPGMEGEARRLVGLS